VYFLATRLLRDAGAGPTFLISPLLALMRDQAAAAERVGCGRRLASTSPTCASDGRSRTRSPPGATKRLPPIELEGHDQDVITKDLGVGEHPLLQVRALPQARLRERDRLYRGSQPTRSR
jgi:hypothetical protein